MSACEGFRELLTAAVDGELSLGQRLRLFLHQNRCAACDAAGERRRAFVDEQRNLLRQLPPVDLDVNAALAAARREMVALGAENLQRSAPAMAEPQRPWLWTAVAGATTALLLASTVASLGGIDAVLVPLGVEDPPQAVAKRADLFHEYDVIRQLDALEHYDAVRAVPLKKKQRPGKARAT